jgi:hypothetical protein
MQNSGHSQMALQNDSFLSFWATFAGYQWVSTSSNDPNNLPQVDNSTPNIMMDGPLDVALKTAHHEGAEMDVQTEAAERAKNRDTEVQFDIKHKFLKQCCHFSPTLCRA